MIKSGMTNTERTKEAWVLREDGSVHESIAILSPILVENMTEGHWEKSIDVIIDLSICWGIVHEETKEDYYAQAALSVVESAELISKRHGVPLRVDYHFYLGKTQTMVRNYEGAISSFEAYLKASIDDTRKAEVKSHLGHALAKSGKLDQGINLIQESISLLLTADTEKSQGKNLTAIKLNSARLKLADITKDDKERKELLLQVLDDTNEKDLNVLRKKATDMLSDLK